MCLIAIAHGSSLVLAANRDEDFARPTIDADWWPDAPDVLGGRDELAGGSWLAITKRGRFAAVTNLRGAMKRPHHLSRGALVRNFVLSELPPMEYARRIDAKAYTGFHLLVGELGGDLVHHADQPHRLEPGIYAISNAPAGEHWPKVDAAAAAMSRAVTLTDVDTLVDELLTFLGTPTRSGNVSRDVFIEGERYGTRASTVIVANEEGITFAERTYRHGGATKGERRFRIPSADTP